MRVGVDQASLVHAMQNHDELTYELVHFATKHKDDMYQLGRRAADRASELAETIRQTLRDKLTGPARRTTWSSPRTGSPAPRRPSSPPRSGSPIPAQATDEQVDADQADAPAAGDVQRPAARRFRAVRLGSLRDGHDRQGPGAAVDRRRRHPVDPPRRARPDGRQPARPTSRPPECRGRAACTAPCPSSWPTRTRSSGELSRDPGRPQAARHRLRRAAGRAGGVARRPAGDGQPTSSRRSSRSPC